MNKNNILALACASLFLLQGCTHLNSKKTDNTAAKVNVEQTNTTATKTTPATSITPLQKCLNDANTLVKLNKKYQKNYNDLYLIINEAKQYASLSNETSDNVKATISPLFEYEVNDRCNRISQLLIDAFKYKIKSSAMLSGN